MDFKSLIMNGRSVREFKDDMVDAKVLTEIEEYIKGCKKLVNDINVESRLVAGQEGFDLLNGVAGYKGIMIKAPNYLLLLSEKKDHYIESAGYLGERAILFARDLGVDSCWITFESSDLVKEKLNLNTDKEVVALIALGYGAEKLDGKKIDYNYSNTNVSVSTNSSERISLDDMVYIDEWGNNANSDILEERALLDAFSYARMAPSALNKQPWRFIVDGGKVVLCINNENYDGSYVNRIDAGIVMLYFGVILDVTMFDSKWGFDKLDKDYKIPADYTVVGYCNI